MKRIALIHDLSGFGRCSLTAAIPVVSALGIQACPLPTAVLSAQTGFNSYFYDDYTDKMNQITQEWVQMNESFDGIYSGFLGSDAQMENVLYFLDQFQTRDLGCPVELCGSKQQRIQQEILSLGKKGVGTNGHIFIKKRY